MDWKIEVVTVPVSDVERARDLRAARAQLVERGIEVGGLQVYDEGAYRTAREGEDLDNVGCVFFNDPDGNRWCVQQIPARD
jgi:hypothetical protein